MELDFVRSGLFGGADRRTLESYLERNKGLARFIENPESVPPLLWPNVLKMAMDAEEYGVVRAVIGLNIERNW